jgi:hypothetical protein
MDWSIVKEHKFENLIALCPTCHTRYDHGEIDRKSMRLYKAALRQREATAALLDAERLTTYIDFVGAAERWDSTIVAIEMIDVALEDDRKVQRDTAVQTCRAAAARANANLTRFRLVHEDDVSRLAEDMYDWIRYWANDVVDGLWPSNHLGADRHDLFDLGDISAALRYAVASEVNMSKHDLLALAQSEPPRLGGSGKRF